MTPKIKNKTIKYTSFFIPISEEFLFFELSLPDDLRFSRDELEGLILRPLRERVRVRVFGAFEPVAIFIGPPRLRVFGAIDPSRVRVAGGVEPLRLLILTILEYNNI